MMTIHLSMEDFSDLSIFHGIFIHLIIMDGMIPFIMIGTILIMSGGFHIIHGISGGGILLIMGTITTIIIITTTMVIIIIITIIIFLRSIAVEKDLPI